MTEQRPEWMSDVRRLPMIQESLRTRIVEMRGAAEQARKAYKQPYFGEPWSWFAKALDDGADALEKHAAALPNGERP